MRGAKHQHDLTEEALAVAADPNADVDLRVIQHRERETWHVVLWVNGDARFMTKAYKDEEAASQGADRIGQAISVARNQRSITTYGRGN